MEKPITHYIPAHLPESAVIVTEGKYYFDDGIKKAKRISDTPTGTPEAGCTAPEGVIVFAGGGFYYLKPDYSCTQINITGLTSGIKKMCTDATTLYLLSDKDELFNVPLEGGALSNPQVDVKDMLFKFQKLFKASKTGVFF